MTAGVAIGLLFSLNIELSANRAWCLVAGLTLYYALTHSLTSDKIGTWAAPALLLMAGLISLGGLVVTDWGRGELIKVPFIYDHIPHLFNTSFGSGASSEQEVNPRVVAGGLLMLLPAIWLYVLKPARPRKIYIQILLLLGAMIPSLVFLLSQSPTAIAGIVAAAIIVWLVVNYRPALLRVYIIGSSLVVLLGFAFTGIGIFWFAHLLPPPDVDPTQRIIFRLEMWLRTLAMLADKPFTGIGLNNFPASIFVFYPTHSLGSEAHAHNIWLQTAADGGLIGLMALLAILVGVARLSRRAWRRHPAQSSIRLLIAGIAIGTLGWLFYGVGESITLAHKPSLLLWGLWGLLAGLAYGTPYPIYGPTGSLNHDPDWLVTKENQAQIKGPQKLINRFTLIVGGVIIVVACLIGLTWNNLLLNLAIVDGQRAWLNQDQIAIARSNQTLQQFVQVNANNISGPTADLIAHLAFSQNDYAATLKYLRVEITQDGQQTVIKYVPSDWTIWRPPTLSLPAEQNNPEVRLYNQWKLRYPNDPLAYARLAVLEAQNCKIKLAQGILDEGTLKTNSAFLLFVAGQLQNLCA